jgi:hypothetical protein
MSRKSFVLMEISRSRGMALPFPSPLLFFFPIVPICVTYYISSKPTDKLFKRARPAAMRYEEKKERFAVSREVQRFTIKQNETPQTIPAVPRPSRRFTCRETFSAFLSVSPCFRNQNQRPGIRQDNTSYLL